MGSWHSSGYAKSSLRYVEPEELVADAAMESEVPHAYLHAFSRRILILDPRRTLKNLIPRIFFTRNPLRERLTCLSPYPVGLEIVR